MTERGSAGSDDYQDPGFRKMHEWSLRKLEKKHDQQRGAINSTRSTIKRLEILRSKYVKDSANLLAGERNERSIELYIADLEQKKRIVELTTLEKQILATVHDLTREMKLLHQHNRTVELLLKLIKDKSI